MLTTAHSRTSLWLTAKTHWRYFIAMWLWPIFAYFSWFFLGVTGALETKRSSLAWFLILELPVFWISWYVSNKPHRLRVVPSSHAIFWTMIVPFMIWGILCFSPFLLLTIANG
jgi:hypothetical protein